MTTPRYLQIVEALKDRIVGGVYPPGKLIPSESQLLAEFGVSRMVVVRALGILQHDGWINSRQGAGRFVCPRPVVVPGWPPVADPHRLAAEQLAALSHWIDDSPPNRAADPQARTWGRLAKTAEEVGEVITAYIGVIGQNPRKGVTHDMGQVRKELLDVAVTALAAVEHLDGNTGTSLPALLEHVEGTWNRAGQPTLEGL